MKSGEKGYEKEKSVDESDEQGYKEEKGKWLEKDPKTGKEMILCAIEQKWTFFIYNQTNRASMWSEALEKAKLKDEEAVPVLFYASCNDNNVFVKNDMPGKNLASGNVFAFNKDSTFKDVLNYLKTNDTIESIVLSCEVDNGEIFYNGAQEEVGNRKIVDVFTAFKNAEDPFLKRVVCLSFTYDVVKNV